MQLKEYVKEVVKEMAQPNLAHSKCQEIVVSSILPKTNEKVYLISALASKEYFKSTLLYVHQITLKIFAYLHISIC